MRLFHPTAIDEASLPAWKELMASAQRDFLAANVTERDFLWLGRRRGDAINFRFAFARHDLWEIVWFRQANSELGFNGIRFYPRFGNADLLRRLRGNSAFADLSQTVRGRYNGLLHPERHNYSETVPHRASLHFNFNDDGPADAHFDYFNAHARSLWPAVAHAVWEYPLKFLFEYSNAEDVRRCLRQRYGEDPWTICRRATV
jgi:hypothetical protein